jgi:hypothetical protein
MKRAPPPYSAASGAVSKFEADLPEMTLGFVMPEGGGDVVQRKTAVDNRLEAIDCYGSNHVLLIGSVEPQLISKLRAVSYQVRRRI